MELGATDNGFALDLRCPADRPPLRIAECLLRHYKLTL